VKVKAIRYAGREDVFNMEVDDTHNYAIENGTIVHNCRYMLMIQKPNVKTKKQLMLRKEVEGADPLDMEPKLLKVYGR